MPKGNPMLDKLEAKAEAKYRALFHAKVDMLLQMGQDVGMIAAHDVLRMGPGRAKAYAIAYRDAINQIARMIVDDSKDDREFIYTKAKVDEQIKAIVGEENFAPWEERYG